MHACKYRKSVAKRWRWTCRLFCVCFIVFFTFFIESALAFRLFRVSCHFIYRFSSFSLLKSTVSKLQCSSSFMFLLGGFFILWTSDFWGLFGFRYICYCFLFSYFGPFAKMFSYYRVLIFARGWIVLFWKLEAARFAHLVILFFAVRHFRWSTTTIYFPITITFSVFAFFVAFLCSRVCVIKHRLSTQCAWTSQCFIGPYLLYRLSYA